MVQFRWRPYSSVDVIAWRESVESPRSFPYHDRVMKIRLHHPARETSMAGPKTVWQVLRELDIVPETVLVIRNDELVAEDDMMNDTDSVEIRPVISGG